MIINDHSTRIAPEFHPSLSDALNALDRLNCRPVQSGSEFVAYCPVHESDGSSHKPSLNIKAGDTQPFVVHCHAGCDHKAIVDALGLPKPEPKAKRELVKVYDYHDANGQLVSQKLRYEPKDFRQRWPDGKGGWVWKRAQCPTPPHPVLYHLPDVLIAKNAGRDIVFVEGEKDVDRLFNDLIVATTTIEGASKDTQRPKWHKDYTEQLSGAKRIVLVPDNDDAGRAHMLHVASQLKGKVGEILWVDLPGVPPKGDISDWLNAGHTTDELPALFKPVPELSVKFTPAPGSQWKQIDDEPAPAPARPLVEISDEGKERLISQQHASRKLSELLGGTLRYDVHAHCWREYQPDTGVFVLRPALVSESRLFHAIRQYSDDFPFTASYVSGVAKCLVWECAAEISATPGMVCFTNGVLDLASRQLLPHSPEFGFTSSLPFAWEPNALDPQPVIDWLRDATGGHDDQVQLLRAYLNAIIVGRPDLQRFLELVGFGGSGKGTFIRLAAALIGDDAVHSTTLKQLEENRFETAKLHGKKLVIITDAERWHGDVSCLKAITGQDPIRFEEKHKQAGDLFTYGGMVLIAANQHTESTDYSSGIQRRRITVRFDHVVPAEQRRDLDSEFEPYLPAVAKWALSMPADEVTAYLRSTGSHVKSLLNARMEALATTNTIAGWMMDNVIFDPAAISQVGVKKRFVENTGGGDSDHKTESRVKYECSDQWLYPNYVVWCEEHGKNPLAHNAFSSAVIDVARNMLGKPVHKNTNKRRGAWLCGLRLTNAPVHELARTCMNSAQTFHKQVIDCDELHELPKIIPNMPVDSCTPNPSPPPNPPLSPTDVAAAEQSGEKLEVHGVREVHNNQGVTHAEFMQSSCKFMQVRADDGGVHADAPSVDLTQSPVATTIMQRLKSKPWGVQTDDLLRSVNQTHPKAGALVQSTLNELMQKRHIERVNGRLVANGGMKP